MGRQKVIAGRYLRAEVEAAGGWALEADAGPARAARPDRSRALRRVTAIVPAFNAESTIESCLASLLAQSRQPDEIIVVDDASRDGTQQAIARLCHIARLGHVVRVVALLRNSGPGVARNTGAHHATGEILVFTDSDCVVPADWVERLVAALAQDGIVGCTGGYSSSVSDASLPVLQHLMLSRRQAVLPAEIASTITSNFACYREAFRTVGGFPIYFEKGRRATPVWGNEDEELGFLMVRAGHRIRWLADVGVKHHFRRDLRGFLRQQRFYAAAIVMSHFRFRDLWRAQSNYSRGEGAVHVVLASASLLWFAAAIATLLVRPGPLHLVALAAGAICLIAWLALPLPALRDFAKQGRRGVFLLKAYGVLLLKDFAWVAGVASGLARSLRGFEHAKTQVSGHEAHRG